MPKRILVTGGTGFIGSALVRRLVKEGHRVRVIDNDFRGSANRLNDIKSKIQCVQADIRNPKAVSKALKGIDSVFHLAYVNGTQFFYSHPELVLDVGVRGMLNVLDGCRAQRVPELILASSSEVYQTPPVVPTDETAPLSIPDPLNPRYSYGGGKLISELMAINYGRTGFKRVIVFRPHNVYGPQMGWEHVLPQFILRALQAIRKSPQGPVPFPIQGDGRQTRAFIHIDDFTDGLMRVFKKGKHLNIYHIGNPEELRIRDVATKVVAYFGRTAKIISGPPMPGGTDRRSPDIHKLKVLGFRPRISFDDGLASIANWYRENEHLNPHRKGSKK